MPATPPPRKLLDQVRDLLRLKHYSRRTEESYVNWIRRYILFHGKKHPRDLGAKEIEVFFTHLAVNEQVAASTQNQAFSALLFLYRYVLQIDLPESIEAVRAMRPKRLPTVLTPEETRRLLAEMTGTAQLMARLLYGSGLRLMECVRLRVKDVDLARREITVRDPKGRADRVTVLPEKLIAPLEAHLQQVKQLHQTDLKQGHGSVDLPYALSRKYPNASQEWGWQYIFPAKSLSRQPETGQLCRHHIDESNPQKAVRVAAQRASLAKPVGPHTLRHCFATHLLDQNHDIRTVQELLDHKDVKTTMIYTHVLNRDGLAIRSPLDA